MAVTCQDTDWRRILFYYDALLDVAPSPVTALNRAVAVAMIEGPDAGIAALDRIAGEPGMGRYYLLPATHGELYERRGDLERAADFYRRALGLMKNATERKFLMKKLERCQRS